MASKCLICDGDIQTNGINAPRGGAPTKKFRPDVESPQIPVLGDRSKFALTHVQYTVLQKVLTLPEEACKNELMFGPYCRECFTNINNVCHCMTALENLQQSVMEFRKDFGTKIQKSCDDSGLVKGTKKRKSNPPDNNSNSQPVFSARSTILNYLNKGVFTGGVPNTKQNVKMNSNKHIHDTISNMDPNTQSPDTHVEADLVVRTTNGNMPAKKNKASRKKCNLPPKSIKKIKPPKSPKPSSSSLIIATKQLKPVVTPIVNASVTPTGTMAEEENGYKCWCCSRVFPTDAALEKHEEVSHRHKCTVTGCLRVFHTPKSLKSHMINAHKITLTKALNVRKMKKCDECSRYFPNYKALNKHQAVKHPKKPASTNSKTSSTTGGRPGRCKICSKIVMDVQAHMQSQHPEAVNENQQKSKTSSTAAATSEEITTNRDSPQQKVKKKVNNGIETRPMKSTRSNPDLFEQVNPKVTETEQLFILKSEETNKTENNTEKLHSPPLPSPPLRSAVPFNFQVPSNIAKLPTPPQTQTGAGSSKYQFKNLLKIGDKI